MSTEILFDKRGLPLAVSSPLFYAGTTKAKKNFSERAESKFLVNDIPFVSWGDDNHYPEDATITIGKTGVLQTAIGFKVRTSFGQGVVARKHQGYDQDGDEVMVPYTEDESVQQYLDGYGFRQYSSSILRDIFKFGNAFPIFYFNKEGKIVQVIARNARHCRMSEDKTKLVVYADFANTNPGSDKSKYQIIDMLDEDDPFTDLMIRKELGKIDYNKPLAFPRLKNYFSNNDFYGMPDWEAANESGWIDVANFVPQFLTQSYKNALTMMWHIQVPRRWYERKFPEQDYIGKQDGVEQRKNDIRRFFDSLQENLSGENGGRSLLTEYGDEEGLGEDKWIIERLKNEIDAKERLNTSAAANSEILFSMMINPSTLGAGMPGGSYAGNAGSGSDIRESYLVSVITTYMEKQQILDPIRLMFAFNGASTELRLKYKETILTTLNTGNSQDTITT